MEGSYGKNCEWLKSSSILTGGIMAETKDSEEIVLPVTRYDNVMNSPHLVETPEARPGAPFHLLETDSETLTASEIRRLAGGIL